MNRYSSQFDTIPNQIIECRRQGLPPPEDMEILNEWFLTDGWDHALASWVPEDRTLEILDNGMGI